jgi:hypothetical protein
MRLLKLPPHHSLRSQSPPSPGGERKDQSTWPNPQSTSRKVLINLGGSAVRESN